MTNSNALETRQQRFLRYSSHMLLTPIMISAGYAQGIEKGVVVLKDGVDVILDQCRRIAALTDKMLEFSEIMEAVSSIQLAEISLGKHVSSYLERYIFASGEKRISFSPDQVEDDLVLASGDLLDLILDNLIPMRCAMPAAGSSFPSVALHDGSLFPWPMTGTDCLTRIFRSSLIYFIKVRTACTALDLPSPNRPPKRWAQRSKPRTARKAAPSSPSACSAPTPQTRRDDHWSSAKSLPRPFAFSAPSPSP